jgi:predicted dehydrogenase
VDLIDVEVATHASAVLTFDSGVIGTTMMSFDVWDTELPEIEIYGTTGTLAVPAAHQFDADVRLKRHGEPDWTVLPPVVELFGAVGTKEQSRRGLGVRDLADAIEGGPHRANATFAFHVLEVLSAIGGPGQLTQLESGCERPAGRFEG